MPRLLMVDDDPSITQIFRILFEREGYEVDVATSGYAAIEKVSGKLPDIMLLDVILPGKDGLEVLREIRAHPRTRHLKIVVFSNAFLTDTVDPDLKEGPTRFLAKSDCSPDQLLKEVHDLLSTPIIYKGAQIGLETEDATLRENFGSETAFYRREISKSFLDNTPNIVNALRGRWQAFVKCETEEQRMAHLKDLSRIAHSVSGHASIASFEQVSQIAAAFEALLLELREDPLSINASTHRTMAHAVDFLIHLIESANQTDVGEPVIGVVLAVDDETTSLWAVSSALEMAQLHPISLNSPETALSVLKQNRFDLIFLDVEMPGKNGYEVCKELRTYSTNKTTPVIFVTGLSDFSSRAKSTLSGGNDFIAKPFVLSELAVKALIHLFKSREEAPKN